MSQDHEHGLPSAEGQLVDPVCGMNVSASSAHTTEHDGEAYHR